uniref:Uncharacterized protein n=1 Tax=Arundo donax TaxID=35708 RepID=A0A0A8ZFP8_ARUDO
MVFHDTTSLAGIPSNRAPAAGMSHARRSEARSELDEMRREWRCRGAAKAGAPSSRSREWSGGRRREQRWERAACG